MKHPLLNPNSTHYQMAEGREAIAMLEQLYTKEDLAVWAKITAMKYRLRIGNKDDVTKEAVKIKTYEDYYKYMTEPEEHEGQQKFPWTDEEQIMLDKMSETHYLTHLSEAQRELYDMLSSLKDGESVLTPEGLTAKDISEVVDLSSEKLNEQ